MRRIQRTASLLSRERTLLLVSCWEEEEGAVEVLLFPLDPADKDCFGLAVSSLESSLMNSR